MNAIDRTYSIGKVLLALRLRLVLLIYDSFAWVRDNRIMRTKQRIMRTMRTHNLQKEKSRHGQNRIGS